MSQSLQATIGAVERRNSLAYKARAFFVSVRNLGVLQSLVYLYYKTLGSGRDTISTFKLYSKESRSAILCRRNGSDAYVFGQIFAYREYRCIDDVRDPKLIIDCGANIGCSSVYFLNRFPDATVICIEPDPDNFLIMETNLELYKARVRAIRSAIWSRTTSLVLGDGQAWARKVKEDTCGAGTAVPAIDIGSLLETSGFDRISLLKIDIEGSEKEVFATNYQSWLAKTDTLVIELHGPECTSIVEGALSGQGFAMSHCDELTVFKRTSAA